MNSIYTKILEAKKTGTKLLAILLDPDKLHIGKVETTMNKISRNNIDFILVGGSTVKNGITEKFVLEVKKHTDVPIVLFPGDYSQITNKADAILFLSLLSGRNPEYLIEQQVKSVPYLKDSNLEIIPTGYILVDGGVITAVEKVSNTKPISQQDKAKIVQTACAGLYLGCKLIYLEAGSGALNHVNSDIILSVKNNIDLPLIVGGGIRSSDQISEAYQNGADLVVIGTAFEENDQFLIKIEKDESIH